MSAVGKQEQGYPRRITRNTIRMIKVSRRRRRI